MSAQSIINMNHSPRNQRDLEPTEELPAADVARISAEVEAGRWRNEAWYAKRIAAEIGEYNRQAGQEYLEKLEAEKGDLLAAYFCDPRTPAQADRDQHDAECQATNESARP